MTHDMNGQDSTGWKHDADGRSLCGNKHPLQKTSSISEGKRKAERVFLGFFVGCQSSTGFTNPVAVATTPATNVVPKVIADMSNHFSRATGVISDWIARFQYVDKIINRNWNYKAVRSKLFGIERARYLFEFEKQTTLKPSGPSQLPDAALQACRCTVRTRHSLRFSTGGTVLHWVCQYFACNSQKRSLRRPYAGFRVYFAHSIHSKESVSQTLRLAFLLALPHPSTSGKVIYFCWKPFLTLALVPV